MSLPDRNRIAVGLLVLSAVLFAGVYLFSRKAEPAAGGGNPPGVARAAELLPEQSEQPTPAPAPPASPSPSDLLPLTVLNDAPFAQEFGAEGTAPERELELVQLAFGDYLSFVKERYRKPFGYHEELIALLVGGNPLRVAPIPPGHARINQQGQLVDHWGRAFDIHPLSSSAIEIRSAGPDGEMHTGDDLHNVTSSGQDILDAMKPVAAVRAEKRSVDDDEDDGGGER